LGQTVENYALAFPTGSLRRLSRRRALPEHHIRVDGCREETGRYFVDGDLTIRGTTRPVTLDLDVNGFSPDTFGAIRVSFSATTTIDRNDFGVSFNAPIPGLDHAMLLSDSVAIILDVQAVLQSDSTTC
jgi:hypothetical protein